MSFEKTQWVWHNGEQTAWEEARIHASAYGIHYGTGVFEGIRTYGTPEAPAIFRLPEHLARLRQSAEVYYLQIPWTDEQLTEAIAENILANGFTDCYIRPLVYFDSEHLGIRALCPVSTTIIAWEWAHALDARKKEEGLRVTISPWRKFHSTMLPTTAKSTGQYLNSILAVRDAEARGFDEAILLDMHGNLAEGAVENLFLVRGNKLLTNDEHSSILLGITRASVIEIARHLGYAVEIGTLTLDDLLGADEVFLTGTAIEIVPVAEVDGRKIGRGQAGPVTKRIRQAYSEIVTGRNPSFKHWLTPLRRTATVGVAA